MRAVHVNMEKVEKNGMISTTGWWYVAEQKVSELLTKTWYGWENYRLTFGVQKGLNASTRLKWFTPKLSIEYDPSLKEWFETKFFNEGENYFLLISILNVMGVEEPHAR